MSILNITGILRREYASGGVAEYDVRASSVRRGLGECRERCESILAMTIHDFIMSMRKIILRTKAEHVGDHAKYEYLADSDLRRSIGIIWIECRYLV